LQFRRSNHNWSLSSGLNSSIRAFISPGGLKISHEYCYSSTIDGRRSGLIKISYARGLVLLLTLMLAGTANLMCISFDPDHNAQTPPLRVDFSFVVRGHGRIQVQRSAPTAPNASSIASAKDLVWNHQRNPLQQTSAEINSAPCPHVTLPLLC
jgi:hypothetical protein